jgi:hypothetical protein
MNASETRFVNARLAKEYKRGLLGIFGGYRDTFNSQNNSTSSRWVTFGGDATYELTRRASAHAQISTDKYLDGGGYTANGIINNGNRSDGEYRNSYTVGIRYELYYDLWVGFDYNRIAYSNSVFSPTGPIEVNRYMFYVTKSFQGGLYKYSGQ